MTAQEYIDKLPKFEWLSLRQVPQDIYHEVFTLLQLNQFENYRIGWYELQYNLFMKVSKAEKEQLMYSLKELENNIGRIEWIYIKLRDNNSYIVSLLQSGKIQETDNPRTNEVFTPGKYILEYFEWIYKHAINIKIRYLNEEQ